ncbi:MAG TPA: DUF3667 domain-containing protein [Aliidongia sp.]|nr:DUF3667 domain-containing protein [Aliidongia sp.]
MPLPHHPSATALAAVDGGYRCANCGAAVAGRFCGDCGQSRHDHSRSIIEIVHELVAHHLFLDGKMMATVLALLLRPGLLTRAFIEGRRVRFVSPIRLYLFASFAFFLALWASGFAMIQFHIPHQAVAALAAGDKFEATPQDGADWPVFEILKPAREGEALPDAIKSRLSLDDAMTQDGEKTPDGQMLVTLAQRLTDGFSIALAHPRALNPVLDEWLPRMLIVTLPFTALLLAPFGRKRGLYFVDHVAFALHLQAFVFVLGLIVIAVRLLWPGLALGWPLFLVFTLYGYVAYLRTYPGNWLWAAVKLAIIGSIYGLALLIGVVALLVYGVSTLPAA